MRNNLDKRNICYSLLICADGKIGLLSVYLHSGVNDGVKSKNRQQESLANSEIADTLRNKQIIP